MWEGLFTTQQWIGLALWGGFFLLLGISIDIFRGIRRYRARREEYKRYLRACRKWDHKVGEQND